MFMNLGSIQLNQNGENTQERETYIKSKCFLPSALNVSSSQTSSPFLGKTATFSSIEHSLNKCHQALKFAFHSDHKGQTKSLWDCPSKQKETGS